MKMYQVENLGRRLTFLILWWALPILTVVILVKGFIFNWW